MATAANKKSAPARTLEQTLWDAADKMRGNLEAGEYKHVVLGLVFLKYISDAFEERRFWLETATADPANEDFYVKNAERRGEIVEDLTSTPLTTCSGFTPRPAGASCKTGPSNPRSGS